MQYYLIVSMSNDRSETAFVLSEENVSKNNDTCHVSCSFRKIDFFQFNRLGANQVILVRDFAVKRHIFQFIKGVQRNANERVSLLRRLRWALLVTNNHVP
jgi:hypothetical protein